MIGLFPLKIILGPRVRIPVCPFAEQMNTSSDSVALDRRLFEKVDSVGRKV